jgi:hypothetical protein
MILVLVGYLSDVLVQAIQSLFALSDASLQWLLHGLPILFLVVIVLWSGFCKTNFNQFTLHGMYRERLVRTFLGASRTEPHPDFIGANGTMDMVDKLREKKLRTSFLRYQRQAGKRSPHLMTGFDDSDTLDLSWMNHPVQPLWVINTALNVESSIAHNRKESLPRRQTCSFTFSSLACGSELTGYCETMSFGGSDGGVTAGTAMAISGAAVNPNVGYSTSALHGFVMSILNVALGWWHGNPSQASRSQRGPTFYSWLFNGLFRKTSAEDRWINLSDGGHFDNLGIYEMLKRRCMYIVAVDASQDPERKLTDLGNAVRRARIDHGAHITLKDAAKLEHRLPELAERGVLIYDIKYFDRNEIGTLLYIKPSMLAVDAQLPADLVEHRKESGKFPHESTLDQYFSEAQFESYRVLGYRMLDIRLGLAQSRPTTIAGLCDAARAVLLAEELAKRATASGAVQCPH